MKKLILTLTVLNSLSLFACQGAYPFEDLNWADWNLIVRNFSFNDMRLRHELGLRIYKVGNKKITFCNVPSSEEEFQDSLVEHRKSWPTQRVKLEFECESSTRMGPYKAIVWLKLKGRYGTRWGRGTSCAGHFATYFYKTKIQSVEVVETRNKGEK